MHVRIEPTAYRGSFRDVIDGILWRFKQQVSKSQLSTSSSK